MKRLFKIKFAFLFFLLSLFALQSSYIYYLSVGTQETKVEYKYISPETKPDTETETKPEFTQKQNIQVEIDTTTTFELYSYYNTLKTDLPAFVALGASTVAISPKLADVGTYSLTIESEDEVARFIYIFDISVALPEVDFSKLKLEVEGILGKQAPQYSIYVYDLKRNKSFGINEEKIFYPGSTSKLPYAIMTLRDVDNKKYSLSYVRPLLEKLIIHGSNTTMMELEGMLGGNAKYNQRVRNELGVDNIFRQPHVVQASDLGKLYFNIYHQKYLSKSSNDLLLYLLLNTGPGYDNRIKQGLPKDKGVTFAHKTGWVTTIGGGEAYNDSGIVYGELTDYVIVILDKNVDKSEAIKMMKPISAKIYDTLNLVD